MDELTQLKERVEVLEHLVDEHGRIVVRLSHQVSELSRVMSHLTAVVTAKQTGGH